MTAVEVIVGASGFATVVHHFDRRSYNGEIRPLCRIRMKHFKVIPGELRHDFKGTASICEKCDRLAYDHPGPRSIDLAEEHRSLIYKDLRA